MISYVCNAYGILLIESESYAPKRKVNIKMCKQTKKKKKCRRIKREKPKYMNGLYLKKPRGMVLVFFVLIEI